MLSRKMLAFIMIMVLTFGVLSGILAQIKPTRADPGPVDAPTREQVSIIKFESIANGLNGSAAVDESGKVWTWGHNAYGKLGVGDSVQSHYAGGMIRIPYFVNNNIHIEQIIASTHAYYVIDENGIIYAWGNRGGATGRMGDGITTGDTVETPQPIEWFRTNNIKAKKVTTSEFDVGVIYVVGEDINGDERLYAWGDAGYRALPGKSTAQSIPYEVTAQVTTEGTGVNAVTTDWSFLVNNIKDIAAGNNHMLVVTKDGDLYSWGFNVNGQLGIGNYTNSAVARLVNVGGGKKVKAVSAERYRSMALTEDGQAYHWGRTHGRTSASVQNTYNSPSGVLSYTYWRSVAESNTLTPTKINFDLGSAPGLGYTQEPEIVAIEAAVYVYYGIDIYGRVWMIGRNYSYGFATDGPLANAEVSGKFETVLTEFTLLKSMGDGDTENVDINTKAKGPVFSGATLTQWNAAFGIYERNGQWAPFDGKHPTIYDKKYNVVLEGGNLSSHQDDYILDDQGRRIIYVVRRENNTGTITYCGNYYVAEDSYTGPWIVDNRNTMAHPAGVTTETSTPAILEEEKDWINLSVDPDTFDFTGTNPLKEPGYITQVSAADSGIMLIDNSGNIYKSSLAGSGAIAWGWDHSEYEYNGAAMIGGNPTYGLYDFYCYELMYLRGAPRIPNVDVSVSKPIRKIYKGVTSPATDTVTVTAKLPASYHSDQLNFDATDHITRMEYVIIPSDPTNADYALTSSPTIEQFDAAYANSAYQKGNWLSGGSIISSTDVTEITRSLSIDDNCKIWVLVQDQTYIDGAIATDKITDNIQVYTADNFYTPINLYEKGVERNDPTVVLYSPTQENVEKVYPTAYDLEKFDEDESSYSDQNPAVYGVPLDANGTVITDPTFGYDQAKITALDVPRYTVSGTNPDSTPQINPVTYTLNQDYITSRPHYNDRETNGTMTEQAIAENTHTFYYSFALPYKGAYIDGAAKPSNGLPNAPKEVDLGSSIEYRITVENKGTPTSIVRTTVTDVVPAGLSNITAISHDGEYDPATRIITWILRDQSAGSEVTLSFTATVSAPDKRMENTAKATYQSGAEEESNTTYHHSKLLDPVPAQKNAHVNSGAVNNGNATRPVDVKRGDKITYAIHVNGNANTIGNPPQVPHPTVTVTDVIPKGLTVVSTSPAAVVTALSDGQQQVVWTLDGIPTGGTTVTVVTEVTAAGTYVNAATITMDSMKDSETNHTYHKELVLPPQIKNAHLNGAETDNGSVLAPVGVRLNDEITYDVEVDNPVEPIPQYDVLFAVDCSGSVLGAPARKTQLENLVAGLRSGIFANRPESRIALLGLNCPSNVGMSQNCTNDPTLLKLHYDTAFQTKSAYDTAQEAAMTQPLQGFANDDPAQFLNAAIDKIKGLNTQFGSGTYSNTLTGRDELTSDRIPVIILISDFEVTETADPDYNNSGQNYWSTVMKNLSDRFDADVPNGILLTVRLDSFMSNYDFQSAAADNRMTNYLSPAGRAAEGWRFTKAGGSLSALEVPSLESVAGALFSNTHVDKIASVTDILPAGLTYVSHTDAAGSTSIFDAATRTMTWNWADLPTGKTTVTVKAKVEPTNNERDFINHATVIINGVISDTNSTYHEMSTGILHLRQMVTGFNSTAIMPYTGYFSLENGGQTFGVTTDSNRDTLNVPFRTITVDFSDMNDLVYLIKDIVPQYYSHDGYIITEEYIPGDPGKPGHSSGVRDPDESDFTVEADFGSAGEYWATVFIRAESNAGKQDWGFKTNHFGKINWE